MNGAPGVLVVVLLPWAVVFGIFYLVFKDKVRILADGSEETHPVSAIRGPGLVISAIGLVLGLAFTIATLL
ncbi:MAG: hypothetical protein H0W81_06690 [Chloroflexi bacterium]|nr:hypothetical protein [Chloroflexota bacterium]